MTTLDQDALFAACRTIYVLSKDKFALPPLMRGLPAGQANPKNEYLIRTSAGSIRFAVTLNPLHADRNIAPDGQLPLTFHAEWQTDGKCVELRGKDRYELVRAFMLGVKMPIVLEGINEGAPHRLSVQLAHRYSFECGEVLNPLADNVCKDICDAVSAALHARSADFFADPQNGRAVWRMRATQELFGDPRPAAETFWPFTNADADEANPFIAHTEKSAASRPPYFRYALAASLAAALIAPAAFLTGFAMHGPVNAPALHAAAYTPAMEPVRPIQIALPAVPEAPASEPVSLAALAVPSSENLQEKTDQDGPAGGPNPASAPKAAAIADVQAMPLFTSLPAIMPTTQNAMPRPDTHAARPAAKKIKVAAAPPKKVARPARRQAPNHFGNPFPSAKKVTAAIAGAMKGIERIPSRLTALVKAQAR